MSMMARPTGLGNIKGTGMKAFSQNLFTPEQMNLFQGLFGQAGPDSFLGRLSQGSPEMFQQLEAPALRQFGELQGNIASRFSGMGSGARRSSGFQNTMNAAASGLAQDLQAQRLGLQRQAILDLMGLSESLLGQKPYQTFFAPKKQSFWKSLLSGAAGGLGQGIGSLSSLFL